ncbi:hypothetical protein EJ04DRAFT_513066 [Polyplosphaeria fusca]|uniref:Uncharacterized protein n=1 Tax=Polyplosphaeria fusca TaxID=682080 RepID=A0A9P4UYU1_9PLEO|nr:hypothetical protein EJ04DRAFT_513066 [Polyplosphaeria fusca]
MSSESSVDSILDAIKALKSEVACLSSNLHSAETRIARLEAATFTPAASPVADDARPSPCSGADDESAPDDEPAPNAQILDENTLPTNATTAEAPNTQHVDEMTAPTNASTGFDDKSPSDNKPASNAQHLDEKFIPTNLIMPEEPAPNAQNLGEKPIPSDTTAADIRAQIAPLNSTMAAIIDHILRLEKAVSHSRDDICERISRIERSTDKPSPTPSPTPDPLREPLLKKPRVSFGQTSTLTPQRKISLNVAGSPFGKYSHKSSPFDNVQSRNTRSSASWITKRPSKVSKTELID